jgi:hypothetical protein
MGNKAGDVDAIVMIRIRVGTNAAGPKNITNVFIAKADYVSIALAILPSQ